MARSARIPRRRARGLTLNRLAALVVVVLMVGLYAGPVQKELRVVRDLQAARQQVAALQRQRRELQSRMQLLQSRQGELDLARSCGYTFPNEHVAIVQDQASTCGGGG
ncbi:MAG TPA: hypothetical protein VKV34_11380 [Thermoleophilia bacterium]|nr:hypothetical protein [Thermoleophilia bacterium]